MMISTSTGINRRKIKAPERKFPPGRPRTRPVKGKVISGHGGDEDFSSGFELPPELQREFINPDPVMLNRIKHFEERYDPIEKELAIAQRYKDYPLHFWRDELGISIDEWPNDEPPSSWNPGDPVPLWSKQREIIKALVKYKKVAVKSGHGIGKSFIASGIVLYLAYVWHCLGLTTAPTFRQVRRILWSEIHGLYNGAPRPLGGKLNQVSLDLGDRWFVEGFATDKPSENIAGIHEENVFVVVDEAGGVLAETFEALEGILTSQNSFVLYIGNPLEASGPFHEAFSEKSGFHQITVSCYDSPNVKHNRMIYSKMVAPEWVYSKEKKWGRNSGLFRSRVLGEFPLESKELLIGLNYLQAAMDREADMNEIVSFGVDVARKGDDRTVIGAKHKSGYFRIIDIDEKVKIPETEGKVVHAYKIAEKVNRGGIEDPQRVQEIIEGKDVDYIHPVINVDDIGVGGGLADNLETHELPVNEINTSEPPETYDPEVDGMFLNKRAFYYWKLKRLFEDGLVKIDDEDLMFELSKIRTMFMPRSGKIRVVDKDEIKADIGRSPDLADCMMLTFAIDETEDENSELCRFV